MSRNIKEFLKENRKKLIGSAIVVAGMVVAYKCGANQVVKRLEGKYFVTYLTKDRDLYNALNSLTNGTRGKVTYTYGYDIPAAQVVEQVSEAIANLPEGCTTVNIVMTSPKK